MNLNILKQFRHEFYLAMPKARDALFNLSDALLTYPQAKSFAELSLSPFFQRKWPSLYSALQDGRMDRPRLQALLVKYACLLQAQPQPDQLEAGSGLCRRLVLGLDSSAIERAESYTSPDRTCIYLHNLPNCAAPTSCGWQFSSVVVVPEQPSSWCYTLDNVRIESSQTAATTARGQLTALLPLLTRHTEQEVVLCADRHYGSASFVSATKELALNKLLRVNRSRVFYRPLGPASGKAGGPRKDGPIFKRWADLQM